MAEGIYPLKREREHAAAERREEAARGPVHHPLTLAAPIAVLVIERHPAVREGLKLLLSSADGVGAVHAADPETDALRAVTALEPDVVLCDVDHLCEEAQELLQSLAAATPAARVLALTASHDADFHRALLRAGARGVVNKDSPVDLILKAIRKVSEGELWFERHVLDAALLERGVGGGASLPRREELTLRERQVIALLAEGLKNCEIADRMKISSKTVRNHLCSIFAKLAVTDRLGLLVHAQRLGIVRPGARP